MKSNYHYPVNLGNEIEITILKLAEIMITLTGSKSKITYKELPEDDPRIRKPDLTLARKLFSYCAKTPLEEGLKKMLFS
jgi:nucleoside-diphosphate-sugar epimerase